MSDARQVGFGRIVVVVYARLVSALVVSVFEGRRLTIVVVAVSVVATVVVVMLVDVIVSVSVDVTVLIGVVVLWLMSASVGTDFEFLRRRGRSDT